MAVNLWGDNKGIFNVEPESEMRFHGKRFVAVNFAVNFLADRGKMILVRRAYSPNSVASSGAGETRGIEASLCRFNMRAINPVRA